MLIHLCVAPPVAKVAVVLVPNPINVFLAVFKSFILVQDDPFHDSVPAKLPGSSLPPKPNPAVFEPLPPA